MSLSGSIEDLPLLEILQVVAFCQKTGHLTVRSREGDAGVIFREGRVVSGYIWDAPGNHLPADPQAREAHVRAKIATILERLVRLREGDFAFNLTERVPLRLGDRDLTQETLADGINPEEMMLDLARKLDEYRREGTATLAATFSEPIASESVLGELQELREEPPVAAAAVQQRSAILLVDDETDVCRVVGRQLADSGLQVAVAASAGHARREMARLAEEGRRFLLVVDLGLPSESGTSFRGGLDVVRHATELATPPPVLLMVETFEEKLRARARRLGVSMIAFKPGLSKLDPLQYAADLRAFGDKLAKDLLPRLEARRSSTAARPAAADAAAPALPAPDGAAPARVALDDAARADALRRALAAIAAEPDPDLVSLQLIHAAKAFFSRAVLFVVKDDCLRGVAGFGAAGGPDPLDITARRLTVPLSEPSACAEAVASGHVWSGDLPSEGPLRTLVDELGPLAAKAATLVPVRAWRETVALLYADAPDGVALPPLEPFLAFVEQAGRTLESALLARRHGGPERVAS